MSLLIWFVNLSPFAVTGLLFGGFMLFLFLISWVARKLDSYD